ncbi:IclR family transcriptional regulator (plasmid) [Rhizobium rhizogenes]|uniref:IclR family transcriptional regulator n=1 Tax=Rhizobium rhizogenes TaxID=359 RepID=UPI00157484D1|nr:IclR family transcriptional regulator [Rhizobium rhizogenes]NTI26618.1 IclR family transcriptional regulator [Rhizobium rhizogenes]QTG10220.1 IclR family transcriptional regulator [Rhizobium rhizogenes]
MSEKSVEGAQVIGKSIALLKFISAAGSDGAKVKDIAAALNMSVPTIYRLARAFEKNGWLERLDHKMSLRLGIELFALGVKAADAAGIRSIARPALVRISEEVGATVFLMCRNDHHVIVVDRVWAGQNISTLTDNVGSMVPMGVGAASIAIMSTLEQGDVEALTSANEPSYGRYDLTRAVIAATVSDARERGYAETQSTLIAGLSALSIPVRNFNGVSTTALSVNLPTDFLTASRRTHIVELLKAEVDSIEKIVRS